MITQDFLSQGLYTDLHRKKMLFTSLEFLILFLITYTAYWLAPGKRRIYILLIASIIFYASWSIPFLMHFFMIITVSYCLMEYYRDTKRNWIFFSALGINILNLVFFKYFYFLSDVLGRLLYLPFLLEPNLRSEHKIIGIEILLPLGISFYTFQIIAYCIDIKRGTYSEKHSLAEVLLFISFFPQLIAGPIMRSSELLPQISQMKHSKQIQPEENDMKLGLWLILFGTVKKIFISDNIVNILVQFKNMNPEQISGTDVWILCICFLIMLYSDFSAYSDLAVGLGKLLGFQIPINFRAPFLMSSFTDLWKRWHLTFSSWIRDYIFIPMGGSRGSEFAICKNLILTFSLAGLWHGASYSFLIWGSLMGLFLSGEVFLQKKGFQENPKNIFLKIMKRTTIWILYLSSGVFFFAPNWKFAVTCLKNMFNPNFFPYSLMLPFQLYEIALSIIGILFFHWIESESSNIEKIRSYEKFSLPFLIISVFLLISLTFSEKKDFFYFQF